MSKQSALVFFWKPSSLWTFKNTRNFDHYGRENEFVLYANPDADLGAWVSNAVQSGSTLRSDVQPGTFIPAEGQRKERNREVQDKSQ
jgi:hypothetical protein